jgi:hypothetical protein
MQKYIITFLAIFLFFPITTYAAQMRKVDEESIVIDENIENDFYVSGKGSVTIKGDIKGDLFIAGGQVDVQGKVGGDLFIGGGNIEISNAVAGNVFVGGGQIQIKNTIGKNLYVFGGNITVEGDVRDDLLIMGGQIDLNGVVDDDARVVGGNVNVRGEIKDDLIFSTGSTNITGNIGGDIYGTGGELNVKAEKIGGDIQFWGNKENVRLAEDLNIEGEIYINQPIQTPKPKQDIDFGTAASVWVILRIVWNIIQIIGFILVGYLLIKFAPIKTDLVISNLKGITNQLLSFGIGCMSFFIGILIVIILFVSLFGIPLAKLLIGLAFVTFAIITPIAGLALGRFIGSWFGQKYNHLLTLLIGITLLQIFKSIPVVGNLLEVYLFFLIIGAVIRWIQQKQSDTTLSDFTTIPGIPHYYETQDPLDEKTTNEDQLEISGVSART